MAYFTQHDMRVRGNAEKLIKESDAKAGAALLTENVTFRKPRRIGFLFLLLFLIILFSAFYNIYFNLGSMNKYGRSFTSFSAFIEILVSLVPLVIAVRQWMYKVIISDKGLVISAFKTKSMLFDEISEIKIGAFKASSFCLIRLKTGKQLSVGSDLKEFLGFVKLLSARLNARISLNSIT